MTSHLRLQSSFDEPRPTGIYQTSPTSPVAKKQKMSLTQTYYVASTARTKLGREAGRPDHNLRRLVGHANLLDSLMVELADAEREQEAWFNQSVTKASKPEQPRHIQWIDTIDEDMEEDDDSDLDSDDGSDIYDEDADALYSLTLRRIKSPPVEISSRAIEYDDDDEDSDDDIYEDEYDEELSLVRVASIHSPPELTLDSDSESSDDESMPASPEQISYELSQKQQATITTTTNFFADLKSSHSGMQDIIMQQQHQQQPLIAAAC